MLCIAVGGEVMELWQLKQMQALPLEVKIEKSKQRIKEWYEHWDGQVYVSFSGGKDSTVLLHLVRSMYPDAPAVFVDTGLEYPEIKEFVRTIDNVTWLKPEISFKQVLKEYGYPILSKEIARAIYYARKDSKWALEKFFNKDSFNFMGKWMYLLKSNIKISDECCYKIKKEPFKTLESKGLKPFIGAMTDESSRRLSVWLKTGCNNFSSEKGRSWPLSFWYESDIWQYIALHKLFYSKIYDMGYSRTGCMFCMFGCHLERAPNRFQCMAKTHPQLYNYCMKPWADGGLGLAEVLDYIKVPYKIYDGKYIGQKTKYGEQLKIF